MCNVSSRALDLQGYQVHDLQGRSWELPAMVVPAGHTIKIHSGHGQHQSDPTEQLAVYLDSDTPIWNNDRDRLTIIDRYGKSVDVRDHQPK